MAVHASLLLLLMLLSQQSAAQSCRAHHSASVEQMTLMETKSQSLLQISKAPHEPKTALELTGSGPAVSVAKRKPLPLIPMPQYITAGSDGPWTTAALQFEATTEYPNASSTLLQSAKKLFTNSMSIPLLLDAQGPFEGNSMKLHLHLRASSAAAPVPTDEEHEEYKLVVTADGAEIEAESEHGLFNGLLTLRQLCTQLESGDAWSVPAVEIQDRPASEWRGVMLDVARHFHTAAEVMDLLTLMALFKLNRFHWHLSDDQGWRFPVDSWPNLADFGQWRDAALSDKDANDKGDVTPERYGGMYTKEEIRDVVNYAKALFIEVIPEIDFPGHVQAAIASYPELGNSDIDGWRPPAVANLFGQLNFTLSPSSDSFAFIKDVIDEEAKQFPSKYIHIGGDEVSTVQWQASMRARQYAQAQGLDANISLVDLQSAFHRAGIEGATMNGRTPVVWEEAASSSLSHRLPQKAVVMKWLVFGFDEIVESTRNLTSRGYDVVLCPHHFTYLDQAPGYLNLKRAYSMPMPESHGRGRVLGGQAQIWTEYIKDAETLDFMAWPRTSALAERFWMGGYAGADFDDFTERLIPRLAELKLMGVRFRPEFSIDKQVKALYSSRRDAAKAYA
eukprot:CAMPEP_0178390748 /NCGR_PEP_ID=MMETSP0689_2-20121128/10806_1 /TAXON_ID=160604 /ORGANISM="Amphidinium massartii, Strain CS-259" /LENGTH=617 /DNA_ID=CAMNT_0020011267 /DNA_START=81 /DNA_END=1934 /DNA_ORIENTATION=+